MSLQRDRFCPHAFPFSSESDLRNFSLSTCLVEGRLEEDLQRNEVGLKIRAISPTGLISDQPAAWWRGRGLSRIRRVHLRGRVCMVE